MNLNLLQDNTTRDVLKKIEPLVQKVLALESETKNLGWEDFPRKTQEFYERLDRGQTLDDLLPEAFALCCEADWRVLGKRPYPCQIQAGIVLHKGMLAEMKTGEGKTLTATMPLYLNALARKGAHLYTSNAYLAKRDSEEMAPVYELLGIKTHLVTDAHTATMEDFTSGITYLNSDQGGFAFLMGVKDADGTTVQLAPSQLYFALLDEVDSVLIDRSNTPLVVTYAAQSAKTTAEKLTRQSEEDDQFVRMLHHADEFARGLQTKVLDRHEEPSNYDPDDYDLCVIPAENSLWLTSRGYRKQLTAIDTFLFRESEQKKTDKENTRLLLESMILNALKARHLYQKDRDYLVQGDKIVLLDKNTGRALPNNVLGDNLHAALQAKEGLPCEQQQQDQGRIHTPGFYSMYHKLCAMTGTAGVGTLSEKELQEVYGLTTVQIPTNKPIQRVDHPVVIYATKAEKYAAAVDAVRQAHAQGRPVLLGVTSIPEGNDVSAMLTEAGIPHKLLTAQNEADEAKIVAETGRLGAVTVATDMAGRGTDILLGGTAEEYRAAAMNDPEQGSTTLTIRKVMRYYYGGPLIPQEFYNAFFENNRFKKDKLPRKNGLEWVLDNYPVPFLYPPSKLCQQKDPVYAEAAAALEQIVLDAVSQEKGTAVYRGVHKEQMRVREKTRPTSQETMAAPAAGGLALDHLFHLEMQRRIFRGVARLIIRAYTRFNYDVVPGQHGDDLTHGIANITVLMQDVAPFVLQFGGETIQELFIKNTMGKQVQEKNFRTLLEAGLHTSFIWEAICAGLCDKLSISREEAEADLAVCVDEWCRIQEEKLWEETLRSAYHAIEFYQKQRAGIRYGTKETAFLVELEDIINQIPLVSFDVYQQLREKYKAVQPQAAKAYAAARREILNAGGLLVLGTGLHESRRIDDQLRGRAGRQGDPGESRFFTSLEDEIFVKYGDEDNNRSIARKLQKLGMPYTETEKFGPLTARQNVKTSMDFTTRKQRRLFQHCYDQLFIRYRKLMHAMFTPTELLEMLYDDQYAVLDRFAQQSDAVLAELPKWGLKEVIDPDTLCERLRAGKNEWQKVLKYLESPACRSVYGDLRGVSFTDWLNQKLGGPGQSPLSLFKAYMPKDSIEYAAYMERQWEKFRISYEDICQDLRDKYRFDMSDDQETRMRNELLARTALNFDLPPLMLFGIRMLDCFPPEKPSLLPFAELGMQVVKSRFSEVAWLQETGHALIDELFVRYGQYGKKPDTRQGALQALQLLAPDDPAEMHKEHCHERLNLLCQALLRLQYALTGTNFHSMAEEDLRRRKQVSYAPWQDASFAQVKDIGTRGWIPVYESLYDTFRKGGKPFKAGTHYIPLWTPNRVFEICYKLWKEGYTDERIVSIACLLPNAPLDYSLFLYLWLGIGDIGSAAVSLAAAALYDPYDLTTAPSLYMRYSGLPLDAPPCSCENPYKDI